MWASTFEQLLWCSHRSHQARGRVGEGHGGLEGTGLRIKGGVRPGGRGEEEQEKPDGSHSRQTTATGPQPEPEMEVVSKQWAHRFQT